MRIEKLRSNYDHLTDFELSTLGGRVWKAMQEATVDFPNPIPDLNSFADLVADYTAKHEVASRRGSALEVSQKNESRLHLLNGLRSLAIYANEQARGHISKLLSTGLQLMAQPRIKQIPRVTERISLRDGRISGQLRVDFKAVQEAWEYEIAIGQMGELGSIAWTKTYQTSSSRGNVLPEIEPGIRYYVRVRARNNKGIGDWSEAVSIIGR